MIAISSRCLHPAAGPEAFWSLASIAHADSLALAAGVGADRLTAVARAAPPGAHTTLVEGPMAERVGGHAPRLATGDNGERRAAQDNLKRLLETAHALGAKTLVVRLGTIGPDEAWPSLARSYARRSLRPAEIARATATRTALGTQALDWARWGLDPVLAWAENRGVTVALPHRARPFDIPDEIEIDVLCADFDGAPLAPWLHTGHWHVRETLAHPGAAHLPRLAERAAGAWLSDACGLQVDLPWGQGECSRVRLTSSLSRTALRVVQAGPWATEHELRAAVLLARTEASVAEVPFSDDTPHLPGG